MTDFQNFDSAVQHVESSFTSRMRDIARSIDDLEKLAKTSAGSESTDLGGIFSEGAQFNFDRKKLIPNPSFNTDGIDYLRIAEKTSEIDLDTDVEFNVNDIELAHSVYTNPIDTVTDEIEYIEHSPQTAEASIGTTHEAGLDAIVSQRNGNYSAVLDDSLEAGIVDSPLIPNSGISLDQWTESWWEELLANTEHSADDEAMSYVPPDLFDSFRYDSDFLRCLEAKLSGYIEGDYTNFVSSVVQNNLTTQTESVDNRVHNNVVMLSYDMSPKMGVNIPPVMQVAIVDNLSNTLNNIRTDREAQEDKLTFTQSIKAKQEGMDLAIQVENIRFGVVKAYNDLQQKILGFLLREYSGKVNALISTIEQDMQQINIDLAAKSSEAMLNVKISQANVRMVEGRDDALISNFDGSIKKSIAETKIAGDVAGVNAGYVDVASNITSANVKTVIAEQEGNVDIAIAEGSILAQRNSIDSDFFSSASKVSSGNFKADLAEFDGEVEKIIKKSNSTATINNINAGFSGAATDVAIANLSKDTTELDAVLRLSKAKASTMAGNSSINASYSGIATDISNANFKKDVQVRGGGIDILLAKEKVKLDSFNLENKYDATDVHAEISNLKKYIAEVSALRAVESTTFNGRVSATAKVVNKHKDIALSMLGTVTKIDATSRTRKAE